MASDVVTISIESIDVLREHSPRECVNRESVRRYTEALREANGEWPFPPIAVSEGDDGSYQLWSGEHRLEAAIEYGLTHVPAEVWEGTIEELYARACKANLNHGQPYSVNDNVKMVRTALELCGELTGPQLAEITGLTRQWCWELKRRVQGVSDGQAVDDDDEPETLFSDSDDEDEDDELPEDSEPIAPSLAVSTDEPEVAAGDPAVVWTLESLQAFHDESCKVLNKIIKTLGEIDGSEKGEYLSHAVVRIRKALQDARTALHQQRPMQEGGDYGFVVRHEERKRK